jgi:hypothetical protein
MSGEVNSIPLCWNCALKVTQLPDALETSEEGVAEVVKTGGLERVTMRGEVNGIPERRNGVLKVPQLPEAIESMQ